MDSFVYIPCHSPAIPPIRPSCPATVDILIMTRSTNPQLCLVIPCYNEELVLPQLIGSLDEFIRGMPHPVRVLLVDDGSRDRTFSLIEEACREHPEFAGLRFSRNFGHQPAVSAGLLHAQGDVVGVLDADLQDPLCEIRRMMEKWQEGYDVVYGVRQNRKEGLFLRSAYALFYRLLKQMASIDLPLDAGDFSLMDRRVVDQINRMPEHDRYVRGLRGWVGFRQTGLPYNREARAAGQTKYSLRRLMRLATDGMISFSHVPLRLAVWLGVAVSALGFLLLVGTTLAVLLPRHGYAPFGWLFLVALVLLCTGIQLLVLGIIGEYVGRIFEEVKRRPLFVLDRCTGWAKAAPDGTAVSH